MAGGEVPAADPTESPARVEGTDHPDDCVVACVYDLLEPKANGAHLRLELLYHGTKLLAAVNRPAEERLDLDLRVVGAEGFRSSIPPSQEPPRLLVP